MTRGLDLRRPVSGPGSYRRVRPSWEEAQQIAEVLDFIDSLAGEKRRLSSLAQFLSEFTGPAVNLRDVRASLAKITGQLSDLVREQRDERRTAVR